MPLSIVRNDITRMNVDAIVNSTNENLLPGGLGVDASIHAAAGPELLEALRKIGYCQVGSAVITGAYNISQCSYIIHAVGPRYIDGKSGESDLLKKCYREILSLAIKNGCSSVAIPTISSGHYRFPAHEAYTIATHTIRETLEEYDSELDVYLVIFGDDMVDESNSENDSIESYITENYNEQNKEYLLNKYWGDLKAENISVGFNYPEMYHREEAYMPEMHAFMSAPDEVEEYYEQHLPFAEMCEWWCKKKNIHKGTFYTKANINKAAFWNIKHNKEQVPKKTTAFACVIGLGLTRDEAEDLLARAGLVISEYYAIDSIVAKYIDNGIYDIDEINFELFDNDLALLGCL